MTRARQVFELLEKLNEKKVLEQREAATLTVSYAFNSLSVTLSAAKRNRVSVKVSSNKEVDLTGTRASLRKVFRADGTKDPEVIADYLEA